MSRDPGDSSESCSPAMGTVLDTSCIADLAAQLASREAVNEFLALFLAMLPGRIAAIEAPLAGTKIEAARTAALSLSSSAAMIGAEQLCRDACLIDDYLKTGALDSARDIAARLPTDARSVTSAMGEFLAANQGGVRPARQSRHH